MLQILKDLISGAAALFRFREKQQDLVNSPAMQANASAKRDAAIRDAATAAVGKNDLEEIRRQAGE
jgi:hypothetical protein